MTTQTIYADIISRIKKIYETYEDRANQLAEANRQKTGGKTDKMEDEFLKGLIDIEKFMNETLVEMRKEERGAKNEFLENIRAVDDCLKDIRVILKKKSLNFKVNAEIKHIIEDTRISLDGIRADLKTIKETKTLGCCGTEYN
jgi:hypothetical protein